jgi:hypothetical protein
MKLSLTPIAAVTLIFTSTNVTSADVADIAFVIDQSASMSGEFSWLSSSISTISQGVSSAGITARFAVAGYEQDFGPNGNHADTNVYQDFTSDINEIINATTDAQTYGGLEYSYNAAAAATQGFSWDDSVAKVMILITDEDAPQNGDIYTETEVGNIMADGDFLLNVIAPDSNHDQWDEAAYSTADYLGVFDLDLLRVNADLFTAQFVEAKVDEIINTPNPVPLPAAAWLFGSGVLGLLGFQRRRKKVVTKDN